MNRFVLSRHFIGEPRIGRSRLENWTGDRPNPWIADVCIRKFFRNIDRNAMMEIGQAIKTAFDSLNRQSPSENWRYMVLELDDSDEFRIVDSFRCE